MEQVHPVIQHIEEHLGLIVPKNGYWKFDRPQTSLQVIAFPEKPQMGATTFCSLGLSKHEFCSATGHVRQELLLACVDNLVCDRIAGLLPRAADYALENHIALFPGQILGPAGPLIPNAKLEALLCLEPLLYPESITVCKASEPITQFIWLVPISPHEIEEIQREGISELVSRWQSENVNVLDWFRPG